MNNDRGADMSNRDQSEKFKQAARDLECDEDEGRWDATLKKVVNQKPAPEQPPEE